MPAIDRSLSVQEVQHAHIVARIYLVSIAAGSEFTMIYEWADGTGEEMGLVQKYELGHMTNCNINDVFVVHFPLHEKRKRSVLCP